MNTPNVNFKVYKRKINIFVRSAIGWRYACSTNASRICRDAVAGFLAKNASIDASKVRAWFEVQS